jgi:cyclopropane-fatty-acyl-phospholipid synthase
MNKLRNATLQASEKNSPFDVWARNTVFRQLRHLQTGALIVRDPLGEVVCGENSHPQQLPVQLTVGKLGFYRRMVFNGVIGAAESFMEGDWKTDDLTGLVRLMIRNIDAMQKFDRGFSWISRRLARAGFWLRKNTKAGSRRNIHEHYDLGNDFFKLFLDRSMNYSSGIFPCSESSMQEASQVKMDRICRKLDLTPGDHLLEIGSGWGGLAIHAAQHFGCRVTTTTISSEQFQLARQRVTQAGLQDQITVLKRDYRDLTGKYDKLVSVEMIEAVGHEFYPSFFSHCDRLLVDEGVMLLQAITMNEQDYKHHLRSMDFIRKYVFPGGSLPSVTALTHAATAVSDMRLLHLEDITKHYVWTLQRWRDAFVQNLEDIRELQFSESFIRKWLFYLSYCEAAFAERRTGCVQIMYAKQASRHDPMTALDPLHLASGSCSWNEEPVQNEEPVHHAVAKRFAGVNL